jgi:hypothetical protein
MNILVTKLEGKIPFERGRHKLNENIKIDLKATDCEDVDWFQLAQDTAR